MMFLTLILFMGLIEPEIEVEDTPPQDVEEAQGAAVEEGADETEEERPLSEEELTELCGRYENLSEQLTVDYQALQEAILQSEEEEDLLLEIKANSNYAKTRIAFKAVVKELGTNSCPLDMEEDFPPLL